MELMVCVDTYPGLRVTIFAPLQSLYLDTLSIHDTNEREEEGMGQMLKCLVHGLATHGRAG